MTRHRIPGMSTPGRRTGRIAPAFPTALLLAAALCAGLLGAPSAGRAAPAAAGSWSIECVDCPKLFEGMTDRSLRLDGEGHPHLAYGGDRLYYARHDGLSWQYAVADGAPQVGRGASLVLDGAGRPRISYYDDGNGDLRFSYLDDAGWHVEVVDDMASSGGWYKGYTSVALTADGYGCISYYDEPGADLKYAYQDASGWHSITVDGTGNVGRYSSLALDESGYPHIAYYDYSYDDLKHAYEDAGGWHVEVVDSASKVGGYPSLAVDGMGRLQASYHDFHYGDLKHAVQEGGVWQITTVDSAGRVGSFSSLAVDAGGYAHISYYDETADDLKYAFQDVAGWQVEVVASEGDAGRNTSIALDASDCAHISYLDQSAGHLIHARPEPDGWQLEQVDARQQAGDYASIELDAGGWPHVSYHRSGELAHELRYARQDGAGWHLEAVDSPDAGYDTALALDEEGLPRIAAADTSLRSELRYASYGAPAWSVDVVAGLGEGGGGISMVVDEAGYPHLAYHLGYTDESYYETHYLYRDASGWHDEKIDDWLGQASVTSLVLAPGGAPHLAYFGDGEDLRHAYKDAGAWQVEVVDADGDVGRFASMALDGDGKLCISYYDYSNGDLKLACQDGLGWQVEVVDGDGDTGQYTSLAFDPDGYAHISYYDKSAGDLRHAYYQDGMGWQLETVDGAGDVGRFSSLAVGRGGALHIGYYDTSSGDLKYALQAGECLPVEGASVAGPSELLTGEVGAYEAGYTPPDATLPVALTWDNGTVGSTASYSWDLPGTYPVTVVAANACGEATAGMSVVVSRPTSFVYLPLVVRGASD